MGQVSTLDHIIPLLQQLELIQCVHVIHTLLLLGKLVEVVGKNCGNRRPSQQVKLVA